eukprot:CAMPEP_0179105752 /NCGR_PEP_ID=MMETSP0796-20121207/49128_1 /TAXON_ID=73915 /ORGANISM="Pyrodinium bahamense, Strain pbaha01" /LENGTH=291 /DNA_ID=CAMNT_0020803745 /DNA_START=33 /DNA_END=908 /DNA_ORIENTATION=+
MEVMKVESVAGRYRAPSGPSLVSPAHGLTEEIWKLEPLKVETLSVEPVKVEPLSWKSSLDANEFKLFALEMFGGTRLQEPREEDKPPHGNRRSCELAKTTSQRGQPGAAVPVDAGRSEEELLALAPRGQDADKPRQGDGGTYQDPTPSPSPVRPPMMGFTDIDRLVQQVRCSGVLPAEELLALSEDEVLALFPRGQDGELLSVGSLRHGEGLCTPCLFEKMHACHRGVHCEYCHFPHEVQKKKTRRPSMKKRRRRQKNRELEELAEGQHQSSDEEAPDLPNSERPDEEETP